MAKKSPLTDQLIQALMSFAYKAMLEPIQALKTVAV